MANWPPWTKTHDSWGFVPSAPKMANSTYPPPGEQFFVGFGWGDRLSKLFAVACARAAYGAKMNARGCWLLDMILAKR